MGAAIVILAIKILGKNKIFFLVRAHDFQAASLFFLFSSIHLQFQCVIPTSNIVIHVYRKQLFHWEAQDTMPSPPPPSAKSCSRAAVFRI